MFHFEILSTNRPKQLVLLKAGNWLCKRDSFIWNQIWKEDNSQPTNDKFPKKELNDYGFDTMWIQDKVFYTSECKENFFCDI